MRLLAYAFACVASDIALAATVYPGLMKNGPSVVTLLP
jgi:hypothetical protein